jgi:hypothetical protein
MAGKHRDLQVFYNELQNDPFGLNLTTNGRSYLVMEALRMDMAAFAEIHPEVVERNAKVCLRGFADRPHFKG